jgi:YD repeat-containing protein
MRLKTTFVFGALVIGFGMLSMTLPGQAWANVSLKNGNFFVGYTDIIYPGGFDTKIERVYNSKTPFKGMFGWGWGNEYEVYLSVSADGSVVVHEYGGGAENRFVPLNFSSAELDKAAEDLSKVAQSFGAVSGASALTAYKDKIKKDSNFRNDEWEKFRAQGKIAARQLAKGAQLKSTRFSYQYVTKIADGYQRDFDTGRAEKFDEMGRLVKISDKNGNFISIVNKPGYKELVDNFNRKMVLKFNARGLLSEIEGENRKQSKYLYNARDELVTSTDVDKNTYNYKYDDQNRHNLVKIDYTDKTNMAIEYYGKDKFESVKSIKDRDGTVTSYEYKSDKENYSASVKVKGADGKVVSDSRYDYYNGRKPDGEEWTQRLVTVLDGETTDTTYSENCGLPEVIKRGAQTTTFKYDNRCHVMKKTSPEEVTELTYDAIVGKVNYVSVKTIEAGKEKETGWSKFTYDSKGNLITASNSEGKGEKLVYDKVGRIQAITDQDHHEVFFKYNENSKPVEITDPKIGTITVSYTNSGEIKSVDSSSGRKIASQVTKEFQELLDIIRPAGVTLAF